MDQRFERISSTQRALWMLRKFESLNLPNLGIQDKYQRILNHYARDIEVISKIYQKNKSDPPIARDLPPIAGELSWIILWKYESIFPFSVISQYIRAIILL